MNEQKSVKVTKVKEETPAGNMKHVKIFYLLLKLLNVKVTFTGMISLLLLATSLLSFSPLTPIAVASPIDNNTATDDGTRPTTTLLDNISLNATAISTARTIELAGEPFAVGQYRPVSQTMINETHQLQLSLEGNTTITLPNATETIRTTDRGQAIITFLPGGRGAFAHGQLHLITEDGSESMTAEFTHYFQIGAPTAIGIAYLSTNSTGGMLAPLNNMIAVYLHEEQPNAGGVIVPFFRWEGRSNEQVHPVQGPF